jgi:CheY-like chemotaxis protein
MQKGRILVVDDDPMLRELSRCFLEPEGYTVSEAASGKLAAEALMKEGFDVITTDLRMPAASGETLIQWILAHQPHMRPRILIITGDPMAKDLRALLDKLGIPVLPKPYSRDQLLAAIRRVTESSTNEASTGGDRPGNAGAS